MDDLAIKMGENYLNDVLNAIGSRWKSVEELPNTFDEFKNKDGLNDPLWEWVEFNVDYLLHPNKRGRNVSTEKRVRELINVLSSDKREKCKYCNASVSKVTVGYHPLSLYDKTYRKENNRGKVCFKHALCLLSLSVGFDKEGFKNRKILYNLYWFVLHPRLLLRYGLGRKLSFVVRDYYISKRANNWHFLFDSSNFFLLIWRKGKQSNERIYVVGFYPIVILDKITNILENKENILDGFFNFLLDETLFEHNSISLVNDIGTFLMYGNVSDGFILAVNKTIRSSNWDINRILFFYRIIKHFLGGSMEDVSSKGYRVGVAVRDYVDREYSDDEKKKKLEQIRSWIRSISASMEVSPNLFLMRINEIYRKIGRVVINSSDLEEISKSRRMRLAFVNGLLTGVMYEKFLKGDGNDK